jgi:hypothetical protein
MVTLAFVYSGVLPNKGFNIIGVDKIFPSVIGDEHEIVQQ